MRRALILPPVVVLAVPFVAVRRRLALILTVARYFTPNGESIDHVGVRPQLRAVDDPRTPHDEALAAALRVLAQPTS